jgi:hypothetical protein
MSNSRAMRRRLAGVTGTSQRKKDPIKNLNRSMRKATEALEGSLALMADRFGPPPDPEEVGDGREEP